MKNEVKLIKKIKFPNEVKINIEGKRIEVTGPKGRLYKDFSNPMFNDLIEIKLEDKELIVFGSSNKRKIRAMIGTICANVKNMIIGVTKGYKYYMKIHYLHFPISIETKKQGDKTELLIKNFLGERKPRSVV
ncbi:MAG: 50S ribosomal protein L6, partial [Candidatus Aenigmatarchaeota archaeon]